MQADDEEARRKRAAELRRAIEDAVAGRKPPASPREFTDREAGEAAEERARAEADDDEEAD